MSKADNFISYTKCDYQDGQVSSQIRITSTFIT